MLTLHRLLLKSKPSQAGVLRPRTTFCPSLPSFGFSGDVMCADCLQHKVAARELGQVAIDADREFAAKEAAFRGKEAHLEDTLKAR